jgi:uncharacterized membrane protein
MASRYELLLSLHIVAAIIWLGAAFMLDLLVYRAEKARDRARELSMYADMEWLANRVFIPSALAVLLFGVLLVIAGPWTFGSLWIILGLTGYGASFLVGVLYFKPEGERIGSLVERHGLHHPELDRRLHRVGVVSRMEIGILFLVVGVMAVKPTVNDVWTLAIGAAVVVAVFALGGRALLREPAGAVEAPAASDAP